MIDVRKSELIHIALKVIRLELETQGFREILVPSLVKSGDAPFRPPHTFQDYTEIAVGQPSTEAVAKALTALPRVYSFQTIYRLSDNSDVHLQEFHYIKLGARSNLSTLMDTMEAIILKVNSELSERRWSEPPQRVAFDQVINQLGLPKGADLEASLYPRLIDEFGADSASIAVTNKSPQFEPLQYDCDTTATLFNADIVMRHCGEVGGGYQVAAGRASEVYQDSAYRQKALADGYAEVDSSTESYLSTVNSMVNPLCYGGLSFERLLQSVLNIPNIWDVPLFNQKAGLFSHGSGMT